MIMKVLGYVGMALVIGLLVQTMMTTYHLMRIDSGLKESLESTERLVEIQEAIIEKNDALAGVVETTKKMDAQLQATLGATKQVHANITQINELNAATLEVNKGMAVLGAHTGTGLQDVSGGLGTLNSSVNELKKALEELGLLIRDDRSNLAKIRSYTEQMNRKVPGVSQ